MFQDGIAKAARGLTMPTRSRGSVPPDEAEERDDAPEDSATAPPVSCRCSGEVRSPRPNRVLVVDDDAVQRR